MVATIGDYENLRRLELELDGFASKKYSVRVVDSLPDRLLGWNDGEDNINVLSIAALRRMGYARPAAAQRRVAAHEVLVHGEGDRTVSDRDSRHDARDSEVESLLAAIDPEAAAALSRQNGEGMGIYDYMAELPEYRGGGLAGNGKEDDSFFGVMKNIYKSIAEDIATEYALLKEPVKNTKGYVVNKVKSGFWSVLQNMFGGETTPLGAVAKGFRDDAGAQAENFKEQISPAWRTWKVYSTGLTDIFQVYAYVDTNGDRVPIAFTTFDDPDQPNEKKLLDGINRYQTDGVSPMKDGKVGDAVIDPKFRKWNMESFIGKEGYRLVKDEPMRTNARLVMIGTRDNGSIWARDYAAEAALPASCSGVEVYKNDRSSFEKFKIGAGNDIAMNVANAIWAPIQATFRRTGINDVYQRQFFNDVVMPYGIDTLGTFFGGGSRKFTYKKS